ncbi:MAG: hypothetical protein L3J37_11820 [Rhodobacteraceae bacterium]|nr:hypothetical protein [Paracoccaceae bacterium]
MRAFVVFIAVIFAVHGPATAQITNLMSEGNLVATNKFGCINLAEAKPVYTPADFTRALLICVEQERFDDAAGLFGAAMVYGMFDQDRVADETADQAILVLLGGVKNKVSEEEYRKLGVGLDQILEPLTAAHSAFCSAITSVGMPDYFPAYMVQHGMRAFTDPEAEPLVQDFPARAVWTNIMSVNSCI